MITPPAHEPVRYTIHKTALEVLRAVKLQLTPPWRRLGRRLRARGKWVPG
jgi:hypothetical protein